MNRDQYMQHKLENILNVEIRQSYEDETGYYVQVNDEWYQLSINQVNEKISNKINKMIDELNSSERK
jgi:hypothetical protein